RSAELQVGHPQRLLVALTEPLRQPLPVQPEIVAGVVDRGHAPCTSGPRVRAAHRPVPARVRSEPAAGWVVVTDPPGPAVPHPAGLTPVVSPPQAPERTTEIPRRGKHAIRIDPSPVADRRG